MRLQENTTLQSGKYRILEMIGQGGFGITYKAETFEVVQKALGEMRFCAPVAIKEFFLKDACFRHRETHTVDVYPEKEELFANFKKRLLERESLLVSKLRHPNIVTVLDAFEENNTAYMVMEFIDGIDLNKLLEQKKRLPLDLCLHYAGQIADALKVAHQKGVIHLDIKPANILILNGDRIKIIDFGIAKQYSVAAQESQIKSHTIVGYSPFFAPPEQCVSHTREIFTPATDIYAFAGTLYQCLTGNFPAEASARIQDEMPSVRELVPSIPEHISNAIAKAMTLKRKERFQSVDEFIAAFKEPILSIPLSVPRVPTSAPVQENKEQMPSFSEPITKNAPVEIQEKLSKKRAAKNGKKQKFPFILVSVAAVLLLFVLLLLFKKSAPPQEEPLLVTPEISKDSIPIISKDTIPAPVVDQKAADTQAWLTQYDQQIRTAETAYKSQNYEKARTSYNAALNLLIQNKDTSGKEKEVRTKIDDCLKAINAQKAKEQRAKDSLDRVRAEAAAKQQAEAAARQQRLDKYQQYNKNLGSNYMVVQRIADNKWGIIDKEGNERVPFNYKQASSALKNGCFGLLNEQNLWDVFNASLTKIASGVSDLSNYR